VKGRFNHLLFKLLDFSKSGTVISSNSMSHTSVSTAPEKREGIDLFENGESTGYSEPEKGQEVSDEEIGEHPKGFRLAMVILALVLSVFLVALDMVYFESIPYKQSPG